MKEKATIYDLCRICKHFGKNCSSCPLRGKDCAFSSDCTIEEADKMNEIILDWCKEHPVKTRQDKFLEMFPNARMYENKYVNICPKMIDQTIEWECAAKECADCTNSYWLAEVEE